MNQEIMAKIINYLFMQFILFLFFHRISSSTNSTWFGDLDSPDVQFWTYITDSGRVILPWISFPGFRSAPICYDEAPTRWENTARLAHLICRHKGSMVASKWSAISRNVVKANVSGLVVSARCRGDEQLIGQCIWNPPVYWPCTDFLALECGDCSGSIELHEGSSTSMLSPGFPVYIPLTMCEWNITAPQDYNVVLNFRTFDLPSPYYDEDTDQRICKFAAVDLLLHVKDLNVMVLEGRFCGRHSPGTLTLGSSRVIMRYTAGMFHPESNYKKGFILDASIIPSDIGSHHVLVSRWVLLGCGLSVLFAIIILLLIWASSKRRRQAVFQSVRTNSTHWDKMQELRSWKVKRKDSNQTVLAECLHGDVEQPESHIYEDIDIPFDEKCMEAVASSLSPIGSSSVASQIETSLTNRRSSGVNSLPSLVDASPPLRNCCSPGRRIPQRISSEPSYASSYTLRPPPYNQALNNSGSSSRNSSGIYINPTAEE